MLDFVKPFDEKMIGEIDHCVIHPGIGIARVGNSPEDFFIGPEMPGAIDPPPAGYKDAKGKMRRQAARFRIYAYDQKGKVLGELPIRRDEKDPRPGGLVNWTAHLVNRKGASKRFEPYEPSDALRNARVEDRKLLVIDPKARSIRGHDVASERHHFTGGTFLGKDVPLGELRTDKQGRLLVLGGFGSAGPVVPGDPHAECPTEDYANNDNWYDDVSDGPVSATAVLSDGRKVQVEAAWVIVAPPNYAPGVNSIVTLYDVIEDTAIKAGWRKDHDKVEYYRDIYPILQRAGDMAWVNSEARRGHGFGKSADYQKSALARPSEKHPDALVSDAFAKPDGKGGREDLRKRIFAKLRQPFELDDGVRQPKDLSKYVAHATKDFMPPLSGDLDDAEKGSPATWLSILPRQYACFAKWAAGDFVEGEKPKETSWADLIDKPALQIEALQRAALEPCVGGAFYPGIETTYIARWKATFQNAFRIGQQHPPGHMTELMAVPWQADFYECHTNWWPAQRPDDVVPESLFDEIDRAWHEDSETPVSEGLEERVRWDRGLGGSTLFRFPWRNPAVVLDDPDEITPFGREDMVRFWSELGVVVPVKARSGETVHVERGRRPYAGMDVRELLHGLLNIDEHPGCREKARDYVERVLQSARAVQHGPKAFANLDTIRPFAYTEEAFVARMNDIYDDTTEFMRPNGPARFDAAREAVYRTREHVIERIRQLTPFNMLDGSWLRNIHRLGPVDDVNSILYSIFNEELGGGNPAENHANIWRDLCHSVGYYPAAPSSTAFSQDPQLMTAAFDSPTFQLAISEFTTSYYPEIIGMTLFLEWTVLVLNKPADMLDHHGMDSHFYRMHIAIDNAASGHGARIVDAIKRYLRAIRQQGGEAAVQEHWRRIWDGYVAFGYTFSILLGQIKQRVARDWPKSETLTERKERLEGALARLITAKKPYGRHNHGDKKLGDTSINALFDTPGDFLQALQREGWIVPGKPDASPFIELLRFEGGRHTRHAPPAEEGKQNVDNGTEKNEAKTTPVTFEGGRMYNIFSKDEIRLWREWIEVLGDIEIEKEWERKLAEETAKRGKKGESAEAAIDDGRNLMQQRARLLWFAPASELAEDTSTRLDRLRKVVSSDRRLSLWLERAVAKRRAGEGDAKARRGGPALFSATAAQAQPAADAGAVTAEDIDAVEKKIPDRLYAEMIRVLSYFAGQSCSRGAYLNFDLHDATRGATRKLSNWLADVCDSGDPEIPGRRILAAIRESEDIVVRNEKDGTWSVKPSFLKIIKDETNTVGRLFADAVPGNDRKPARETFEQWLEAGCPLAEPGDRKVKPLTLDSTLEEEERHPTGVIFGFYAVH